MKNKSGVTHHSRFLRQQWWLILITGPRRRRRLCLLLRRKEMRQKKSTLESGALASGGMGGMQPCEGRSRASNGLQGQAATHPHLAHTPRIAPIFNWAHLLMGFFAPIAHVSWMKILYTHKNTLESFSNKHIYLLNKWVLLSEQGVS